MTLTLSSGHIFGKGFANSDQKYRYLPKISTDSILAVIGEETGLIGVSFIIILYFMLISSIFTIASMQVPHSFEALFSFGVGCWIGFQSLINMSAVVSLIPLTGITLPLISYGGSSLIMILFSLGLIYNLLYFNQHENKQGHRHHRQPSHSSH
jgi:cell division protein FtsW